MIMRHFVFISTLILFTSASAQGPEVTSWIINPGTETGYAGILSNTQSIWYTTADVYVVCTCIPGYDIGPWAGNPNTPANQNFTFKITRSPVENTGIAVATGLGHIGVWRNGVSIFNAKDGMSYNSQGIWNRDALVWEGSSFDVCLGHPAPNGEYHHHVNPACLYDYLDDQEHADLIGHAFDGFPIYGAYGFADPDGTGGIVRIRSSYQLRAITDRTTLPDGTVLNAGQYGPAIGGQYPLGAFIEDYEYVAGLGDLDEHNGRWCVTPEHPTGTYAYFVTIDAGSDPIFPYVIGPTYYGTVPSGNTGPGSGHNTIPGAAVVYDPTSAVVEPLVDVNTLSLYPSPFVDKLNISASGHVITSVDLFDPQGRMVMGAPVNAMQAEIPVGNAARGTYAVRITFANGQVLYRRAVRE